ncbi:hypothetical protein OROGR_005695 [Orobanche gracilis]
MLMTLALLLPVSTAMVERAFSEINLVKTRLRNRMGDERMNDNLCKVLTNPPEDNHIFLSLCSDIMSKIFSIVISFYSRTYKLNASLWEIVSQYFVMSALLDVVYPVSEEREPLSSRHATVSGHSAGLLVDTNLDTSVPDTYRPPPAPIPYETYGGHPTMPSRNRESTHNKTELIFQTTNSESIEGINSSSALETKVKDVESDEKGNMNADLAASNDVEDEKSNELKKSVELVVPPLLDEEEVCPTCLEGAVR